MLRHGDKVSAPLECRHGGRGLPFHQGCGGVNRCADRSLRIREGAAELFRVNGTREPLSDDSAGGALMTASESHNAYKRAAWKN
jgi:hypothetical protein